MFYYARFPTKTQVFVAIFFNTAEVYLSATVLAASFDTKVTPAALENPKVFAVAWVSCCRNDISEPTGNATELLLGILIFIALQALGQ